MWHTLHVFAYLPACLHLRVWRVCVQAPMLYCGEKIGDERFFPKVDIAVDPLDGTSLVAKGMNGAVAVIAMAEMGALFDPGPCM